MAGTFGQRTAELQRRVGRGMLEGRVHVDQAYAFNQHEGYWLHHYPDDRYVAIMNHPGGGGAKYLERPLFEGAPRFFQRMAERCFEPGGLRDAMAEAVDELAKAVYDNAPRDDDGYLRNSAHVTVSDDGTLVHDVGPLVGRVPPEELDRHRHGGTPRPRGSHFSSTGSFRKGKRPKH